MRLTPLSKASQWLTNFVITGKEYFFKRFFYDISLAQKGPKYNRQNVGIFEQLSSNSQNQNSEKLTPETVVKKWAYSVRVGGLQARSQLLV